MTVSIREAEPADAETIREVHLASIRVLGREAYTKGQVEAWAHDRDPGDYPIDEAGTDLLLAERDDCLLGFGWLHHEPDEYFSVDPDGKIGAVYVRPGVDREGIGSTIYEGLEERARAAGFDSLALWASMNAVPFYQAHGYETVREVSYEFDDGVEGPVLEMVKRFD